MHIDVDALRRFYSEQAIGVGRIVILFVINFTAIAFLNIKLALISIFIVPVIILTSIWFFKRVPRRRNTRSKKQSFHCPTGKSGGVRSQAFARQEYEVNKFNTENWKSIF
jgi:ATP-binding cassette subfamily B protein